MTTRNYKGFTITHLHGTMTFKVYLDDELIICKSTLQQAKLYIDGMVVRMNKNKSTNV